MSLLSTLIKPQKAAFNKISRFLESPSERFFRLSGYAGTGKTFLIACTNEQFPRLAQLNTSPTNKATKVLSKKLAGSSCKTIYSALGIKMVADEDRLVLEFPRKPQDLNAWDVVWIDEGSMLNGQMVDYVTEVSNYFPHLKWIFSADRAQLNPIGEKESPIWNMDIPSVELTDVVRYDNQILALATHIRNQIIDYPDYELNVRGNHANKEGVWRVSQKGFRHYLERAAKAGYFNEVDHTKAIAWRNITVNDLNTLIRFYVFGRHAYKEPWIVGDRVMIASPVINNDGGTIKAHIDDEGSITSVKITHNTFYKDLKCYNIVIQMDDDKPLEVSLIHESSAAALSSKLNELAAEAKKDRTKWKNFWALKNTFHHIRHSYGLTSHRAQGSTFKYVLVDMGDIFKNLDELEALRSFYVSCTRPTTGVIVT